MLSTKTTLIIATCALVALPLSAGAQEGTGVEGRWSAQVALGAAVPAGGEFHQGGSGFVLGLPTSVDAQKSQDIYDPGIGWRAGLGYGVSHNVEVFGDFAWKRAEASELSVGNVANLDLRAAFGDYTSYGMDAGVRYHFMPDAPVNPYITGLSGFRRVEAITGTFAVPAAGVTLANTPFFDDSYVPIFGSDVGVLFEVTDRMGLGIEAGIRYHGDLNELEGLSGTGLENLNNAGSRWSVPVSGVLRFGF